MSHHLFRRVATYACSVVLAVSMWGTVGAQCAHADDEVDELQAKVESTARQYDEAKAKVKELNGQIKSNAAKIDKLAAEIPKKQERSNEAVKNLYLFNQSSPSIIDMVLSTDNINDFIDALTYCNRVIEHDSAAVNEAKIAKEELETTRAQLNKDKKAAVAETQKAADALAEAKKARKEAMERAAAEAAAQLAAQRQAELEAQAANTSGADAENTESTVPKKKQKSAAENKTEAEAEEETPEQEDEKVEEAVSSDSVDWSSDKQAFVDKWAKRIDDYLAGSPLGGYGEVFAAAAWDYGVDPRWSPAISNVESSKGVHCFRPHNAWGWGSSGWGSWEEAIQDHVAGLARGYGSTLTYAAACKYCPPNSRFWYNGVLEGMNSI